MGRGRTIVISLSVLGILAGAGTAGWYFWEQHNRERAKEAAQAESDRRQEIADHDATPPIDTSIADITKTFADNEVAARAQWIGNVVRVSGVVDQVTFFQLADGERPAVMLRSPRGFPCVFPDDIGAKERLAGLRGGQRVTVRGVCRATTEQPLRPFLVRCVLEDW